MSTTRQQPDKKEAAQSEKNAALLVALLLNEKQASLYLGLEPTTLKTSRAKGTLLGKPAPAWLKFGRTVRYKRDTLEAWAEQYGKVISPSECGGAAA